MQLPGLRLINCDLLRVELASSSSSYAALSYVWGQSTRTGFTEDEVNKPDGFTLPSSIPKVVRHSISVTKALGLRYLLVDKYCINQDNPEEKHYQISQMGSVYKGAELTIVADAGTDEDFGLPGVGSTPRTKQAVANSGDITIIPTMAHPHHVIENSTW